jgi:hypothetical protein
MYCSHCGNALKEGQRFCDQCGSAIAPNAGGSPMSGVPRPASRSRRGLMRIVIALAVVILAGGGILYFMANGQTLESLQDTIADFLQSFASGPTATFDSDAAVEGTVQALNQTATQQAADATSTVEPEDPYAGYARIAVGLLDQQVPAHSPILVTWGWVADTEEQVQDFLAAVTTDVRMGANMPHDSNRYWSEPREYSDTDGDGDMDYISVFEWPIEEGLCEWEYEASGVLTLDRPISDGWNELSGEVSNHEFTVRIGDPPDPTPMHFRIVNDMAAAGYIGQAWILNLDCSLSEEVFGWEDAIEIPVGSSLEVETMLPPGNYSIVFSAELGGGRIPEVEIREGSDVYINSDTAEMR